MLIQCTKKLLDQLKIKPQPVPDELPLFSWHANLITVNHRKTVVLMNDETRYILVLYGLKAKDFQKLDTLILETLRQTLAAEYVKPEIAEQFISRSPGITYTKTKDRSMVARMNKACDEVYFYSNVLDPNTVSQIAVGIRTSSMIVGDGQNDYIHPYEEFFKCLESYFGEPVFLCRAVQLKIRLLLENHEVWRRIIVPLDITFQRLHKILQIVFQWQDYHLHEFAVYNGDNPLVTLVCSSESFEYEDEIPMILETEKRLNDYIPLYSRIIYTYDLGDNWEHEIIVEKMIDAYDKNYPECIEGQGNTPPEDVGGEYGYDEFLQAISNPNHPEHQDMLNWGKMQHYQDFSLEFANRRLKNVLRAVWER